MAYKTYRELVAWQKAMDLVQAVYRTTGQFPKDELYGLTAQLRRAAISLPSNIAEGQGRNSRPEFLQFLSIAYGSLRELETQLLIAERLGYMGERELDLLMTSAGEVGRLINGLARSLHDSH